MPYVSVGKENSGNIEIYYRDWGNGQPVVFSHGWPLSGDADRQPVAVATERHESFVEPARRKLIASQ